MTTSRVCGSVRGRTEPQGIPTFGSGMEKESVRETDWWGQEEIWDYAGSQKARGSQGSSEGAVKSANTSESSYKVKTEKCVQPGGQSHSQGRSSRAARIRRRQHQAVRMD